VRNLVWFILIVEGISSGLIFLILAFRQEWPWVVSWCPAEMVFRGLFALSVALWAGYLLFLQ
jgi:hypothetical protein